jgi:hypothetical protein
MNPYKFYKIISTCQTAGRKRPRSGQKLAKVPGNRTQLPPASDNLPDLKFGLALFPVFPILRRVLTPLIKTGTYKNSLFGVACINPIK